jgi:hypothetical protein
MDGSTIYSADDANASGGQHVSAGSTIGRKSRLAVRAVSPGSFVSSHFEMANSDIIAYLNRRKLSFNVRIDFPS